MATISNEDNSFECHFRYAWLAGMSSSAVLVGSYLILSLVRCNEVKSAQFVLKSAEGQLDKYIIRFLSETGDSLLSAILHAEGAAYEEGAVEFWQAMLHARQHPFPLCMAGRRPTRS